MRKVLPLKYCRPAGDQTLPFGNYNVVVRFKKTRNRIIFLGCK